MDNKVLEAQFKQFAEFLFSKEYPPDKNTISIDIDYQDDSAFSDFLYDLFSYGFYKKFSHLELKDMKEEHFNIIRDYIRAIGADVVLFGYDTNDFNEVINIKLGFKPFYES